MAFYTTNQEIANKCINEKQTGIYLDTDTNTLNYYKNGVKFTALPYKPLTFDDLTDEQKAQLKGEKGDPGEVDYTILENLISNTFFDKYAGSTQDYIDDNGSYPSVEDMESWLQKRDILDFDYDLDGVFSIVDLYLPVYVVTNSTSNLGDKYDPINKTYNGKSLDINGDGAVSIADAMDVIRTLSDYRNTSKVDLHFYKDVFKKSFECIEAAIDKVVDYIGHYPTYSEFINTFEILKYDYDDDGVFSIIDIYIPLAYNNNTLKSDSKFNKDNLTYNGRPILVNNATDGITSYNALKEMKNNMVTNDLASINYYSNNKDCTYNIIDPLIWDDSYNTSKINYLVKTELHRMPTLKEYNDYFYINDYSKRWDSTKLLCEYNSENNKILLFSEDSRFNLDNIANIYLYNNDNYQLISKESLDEDGYYTVSAEGKYRFMIELPANTSTLPQYIFEDNSYIETVILPKEITNIGTNTFRNANNIKNIIILYSDTLFATIPSYLSGTGITIYVNKNVYNDYIEEYCYNGSTGTAINGSGPYFGIYISTNKNL